MNTADDDDDHDHDYLMITLNIRKVNQLTNRRKLTVETSLS